MKTQREPRPRPPDADAKRRGSRLVRALEAPLSCPHCRRPVTLTFWVPRPLVILVGVLVLRREEQEPLPPNAIVLARGRAYFETTTRARLLRDRPSKALHGRTPPLQRRVTCTWCRRRPFASLRIERALSGTMFELATLRKPGQLRVSAVERGRRGIRILSGVVEVTLRRRLASSKP